MPTAVAQSLAEWDYARVVREGFVSTRHMTHHTSEVIKAAGERGKPVYITRHNRIVAAVVPVSMREVVDGMVANIRDLRDSMTNADAALAAGKTVSAVDGFPEDD